MTGQQAQRRPLKYYLVQILVVPSPPNINHVLNRKSQREKQKQKKVGNGNESVGVFRNHSYYYTVVP